MPERRDHLLPGTTTALERTGGAASARLDDIPVPIVAARDPALCPVALLPWLAQHHAVDEWDPAWPEATKRAVIAASYEVKRRKGTRAGVMLALQSQGFLTIAYDTWFEYGGSPYRFKLTLSLDGEATWSAENDARALRTALRMKAERSRLELFAIERTLPASSEYCAGAPLFFDLLDFIDEGDLILPPGDEYCVGALFLRETLELEAT